MKTKNPMFSAFALKSAMTATVLALLSGVSTSQADGDKPEILDPASRHYGKTYGQWSAEWWKWAFSLPVTGHPLFDETGENAAVGQSGRVWFLGGTFAGITVGPGHVVGTATRNITVPEGKALFFPIINNETDNIGFDPPLTVEELRALAKFNQDHATGLTCRIDGRAVRGLSNPLTTRYRVTSPVFDFTVPEEDNLYQFFGFDVTDWGFDAGGPISPAVADGVFVMLAPLSPGQHRIHFAGALVFTMEEDGFDFIFELDITYRVNIVDDGDDDDAND